MLRNIPNAEKLFLASFDMESLYTDVPLNKTINIVLNSLFAQNICNRINKDFFQDVTLTLCIMFDKFCKQTFSLGMFSL